MHSFDNNVVNYCKRGDGARHNMGSAKFTCGIFRATAIAALAVCVGAAAGCKSDQYAAKRLASLERPVVPAPPKVEAPKPRSEEISGCPEILGRSTWAQTAPIKSRLEPMGKIARITIHHEGMDAADICSTTAVKEELRKIQVSHENRMQAGDIGYHYIIDYSGRIWEGRPLQYQGAHSRGVANKGNIGVVLLGNFEVQRPGRSQLDSLNKLVAYLMTKYNVPLREIYTHREILRKYELGETDCPGRFLQAQVDLMRKVLAKAGD